MTRDDIIARLNGVFIEVFDDEEIQITEEMTAKDIEQWDSFMHITLISEVEDSFSIRFEMDEVLKMKNVKDMINKIAEKII